MVSLSSLRLRLRSFICIRQNVNSTTISSNADNNPATDSSGTTTNNNNSNNNNTEGAITVWEEKQIMLLEKLHKFTKELSKEDFHVSLHEEPDGSYSYDSFDVDAEQKDSDKIVEDIGSKKVCIPKAGQTAFGIGKRQAPVLCAICIETFKPGDRVCWSSNESCPHVFHEECIVQWLMALIVKQRQQWNRRQERERNRNSSSRNNNRRGSSNSTRRRGRTPVVMQEQQREENRNRNQNANDETETTAASARSSSNTTNESNTSTQDDMLLQSIASGSSGVLTVSESSLFKSLPKECPCCRQDFIVENVEEELLPEKDQSKVEEEEVNSSSLLESNHRESDYSTVPGLAALSVQNSASHDTLDTETTF